MSASNADVSMDIENLKWVLDRNSDCVRDADNKAAIVLSAIAVISTVLFSSDMFCNCAKATLASKDAFGCILLASMLVSAILCVAFSWLAIIPRVSSHERSLIYFGDISRISSVSEYNALISESSFSLRNEILNQIIEVSAICSAKMKWQTRSQNALPVLVVATVFYICRALLGSI